MIVTVKKSFHGRTLATLAATAQPAKQELFQPLPDGFTPTPQNDIAALLGMTQSAISHQLRALKNARLVKARRDGKTVFYALADGHVRTIIDQGLDHVRE